MRTLEKQDDDIDLRLVLGFLLFCVVVVYIVMKICEQSVPQPPPPNPPQPPPSTHNRPIDLSGVVSEVSFNVLPNLSFHIVQYV